jgi:hypothetical protein
LLSDVARRTRRDEVFDLVTTSLHLGWKWSTWAAEAPQYQHFPPVLSTPDRTTDSLLDDLRAVFIREVNDVVAASLLAPLKDDLFEKALRLNTALLAQKREERQQGGPAVTDPGAIPMRDLDRIIASATPDKV